MANYFGKKATKTEQEEKKSDHRAVGSKYGRAVTSVAAAKEELFKKSERQDPVPFIKKAAQLGKTFYGVYHTGPKKNKPFALDEGDTTMEAYVGSTGTGKGVLLGNKAREAIEKRKGLIIIDPKKDSFLPQICREALLEQGREKDFYVASWPDNFGYMGINEEDTYIDIANKFTDALGLEESDNPGVDYYRKNARVLLKKILKIFFNGDLGVVVKKDFRDILRHIRYLKEDLEKQALYEKELSKNKPNANLIQKYEKRYFDQEKIDAIYWDTTDAETLDSLSKSLAELAEGANIYPGFSLSPALYEGAVIYLKVDMLDPGSLKMVKMMITDAIQQARRKKADTVIIADELSFYANRTVSGALATVRAMGLKFLLAFQDIGQLPEEVRAPILSNCNVKVFYKISDRETLEYVEKIGGKEIVTKYGQAEGKPRISQDTEELLNATRIRALPRTEVAILIAEALPEPVIVRTAFVAVGHEFDWPRYEAPPKRQRLSDIEADDILEIRPKERYRVTIEEELPLLEDSDLTAVKFGCEEIL